MVVLGRLKFLMSEVPLYGLGVTTPSHKPEQVVHHLQLLLILAEETHQKTEELEAMQEAQCSERTVQASHPAPLTQHLTPRT